ncbi:CoA-binding protein [Bacteroidota bacterium]|jgi:predicted CoA-binding protein|nr:CoA-binding protein [Bacteroidota bacterium]
MGNPKPTLVLGASEKEDRYSNRAIKDLQLFQHPVYAVGVRKGMVGSTPIETTWVHPTELDTVTLYLSPENQKPFYNYLLELKPKRIIFNPGTENEELQLLAQEAGINTLEACTLVLLRTGQY